MIKIKLLAQFPNYLPDLAKLWVDTIGQKYLPNVSLDQYIDRLKEHLNEESLPLTYIAIHDSTPIGMASLRMDDGLDRYDLFPWLGSLCVAENYRKRGIGKLLIQVIKSRAFKMGFRKLYLSTFDESVAGWYKRNEWIQMPDEAMYDGKKVILMEIEF